MSDYYAQAEDVLPLWRKSDPATSKEAGRRAAVFKGGHEALILEALAAGPGTKDQIAERCGLTEQQVARRMAPLIAAGVVEIVGRGRSASGGSERVYRRR